MKARDNPFSTDRVLRLRYRVPGWAALLDRLSALHYRAAIVGSEGAGKTTLLEDLAPHLTAFGFDVLPLFINRDTPRRARNLRSAVRDRLRPNTIVLLDGAEQMSRWQWLRFRLTTKRAAGLIITSHQPGMLPTVAECRTSPELLDSLLHELIGDAATSLRAHSHDLFVAHKGNLRDVFRALYDEASQGDAAGAPGGSAQQMKRGARCKHQPDTRAGAEPAIRRRVLVSPAEHRAQFAEPGCD